MQVTEGTAGLTGSCVQNLELRIKILELFIENSGRDKRNSETRPFASPLISLRLNKKSQQSPSFWRFGKTIAFPIVTQQKNFIFFSPIKKAGRRPTEQPFLFFFDSKIAFFRDKPFSDYPFSRSLIKSM
jgi:hypothetical protein